MTKLENLKLKLLEYKRTKSIVDAVDICNWLYAELIKKNEA